MISLFLPTLLSCATEPPEAACDLAAPHLLVATVDRRFSTGLLAAVDPATGCTTSLPAVSLGPDPLVRALPGAAGSPDRVAIVNRAGPRNLSVYDAGRYEVPAAQVGLDPGANVHDVASVGDRLVTTAYDAGTIEVRAADGQLDHVIDLAPWADADGLAEPDRFVIGADGLQEGLQVVLQRMTRATDGWRADEMGQLVAFDAESGETTLVADLGPNPRVGPVSGGPVVVASGLFGAPDGDLTVLGAPSPLVREQGLGVDIGHVAVLGDQAVVLGTSFDWEPVRSVLLCIDLRTGSVQEGDASEAWWIDAVPVPERGAVFAAARGFGDATERSGVFEVSAATCSMEAVGDPLLLDPYALAWVGDGTMAAARMGW